MEKNAKDSASRSKQFSLFPFPLKVSISQCVYNMHCNKSQRFSRPQPGCHLPNSPRPGNIILFPAGESLVSDIPAGDGKTANIFFTVVKVLFQRGSNTYNSAKFFENVQGFFLCVMIFIVQCFRLSAFPTGQIQAVPRRMAKKGETLTALGSFFLIY